MRALLPTPSAVQQALLSAIMRKLVLWLMFNVAIAVLPFAFRGLTVLLTAKPVDWKQVLSDGELFLVAAAIAGGAIGELIAKGKHVEILRVLAGGGCVVCLILASLLYAFIRAQSGLAATLSPDRIYMVSLLIFLSTFVSGAACVILSEVK